MLVAYLTMKYCTVEMIVMSQNVLNLHITAPKLVTVGAVATSNMVAVQEMHHIPYVSTYI